MKTIKQLQEIVASSKMSKEDINEIQVFAINNFVKSIISGLETKFLIDNSHSVLDIYRLAKEHSNVHFGIFMPDFSDVYEISVIEMSEQRTKG